MKASGTKLRVGIDARFATRNPRRGIGTYSLNLLRSMCVANSNVEFFIYLDRPDVDGVLPVAPNVRVRLLRFLPYPIWEQVALPMIAMVDRLDVLHCLGNTGPIVLPRKVKLVLSLLDVMFLQAGAEVPMPVTTYQKLGRWYRSIVAPRCARRAHWVVTISECSKGDILKSISGVRPQDVVVTYLSCDQAFSEGISSGAANSLGAGERPFILCLGAHDPRKNTRRVVRAYLNSLVRGGVMDDLVIVGYKNWQHSEVFNDVVQAGAVSRVKFNEFVSLRELVDLYGRAKYFVYPSLYEGFGIPVLEAFASGCPVITSNISSLPEVGSDAVLYVDPTKEEDIGAAMLRLSRDEELRRSLAAKGRARAGIFSWSRTAAQTLHTYASCRTE